MNVDLTDAAAAYGLDYVPEIVWDDPRMVGNASFDGDDRMIHIGPDHLTAPPFTLPDSQKRFAQAVGHSLSYTDQVKFCLAHELYHAVQWDKERDMFEWTAKLEMYGLLSHDDDPVEQDADTHAAAVYQLIKVSE